jgi:flagellar biosynthesis regulator FlaF
MDADANYYLNILALMGLLAGILMVYGSYEKIRKKDNFDNKLWTKYVEDLKTKSEEERKKGRAELEESTKFWKVTRYDEIRKIEFQRGYGWALITLSIAIEVFKGGLKL